MTLLNALRGKHLVRLLAGLLLLVVVAVAGAVAFRKPLLERGIAWWMDGLEIPLGSVTVERLNHRTLVLTDLRAGPANLISAGRIDATYSLPDLVMRGQFAVHIDNLDVVLDLERAPNQIDEVIAIFQRLRARSTEESDAQPATDAFTLPQIRITDGRFSIAGPFGLANLPFQAATHAQHGGFAGLRAELLPGTVDLSVLRLDEIAGPLAIDIGRNLRTTISTELKVAALTFDPERTDPLALNAQLNADLDPGGETLDLSVTLNAPDAGITANTKSRLTNVLSQPEGTVELAGKMDEAAGAGNTLTGFPINNGAFTVGLQIATDDRAFSLRFLEGSVASVTPADGRTAHLPPVVAALLRDELSFDLSQSRLEFARPTGNADDAHWRTTLSPRLSLQRTDGARATARADAVLLTADDMDLLEIDGTSDLSMTDLSVLIDELQVEDVRADLAIDFSGRNGTFDARLREAGTVAIGALSTQSAKTETPVVLDFATGTFRIETQDRSLQQLSGSLGIQVTDPIRVATTEDKALVARVGTVRLSGSGRPGDCAHGTVELDESVVEAVGLTFTTQDTQFALSYDCAGDGLLATAGIGSVRQEGDLPLLAPVSVQAQVSDGDGGYLFDGGISLLDGTELLVASGTVSEDGSAGEIAARRTAPLEFSPDGVAPTDFSEVFDDVKHVRGVIDGSARYEWSNEGANSAAMLEVSDLAFSMGAVSVSGLDFGLVLQPVWPPQTPDSQALSIERIDAGVVLERVTAGYDVLPAQPFQVRVNGLETRFLDGTLRFAPFTVDPAQATTATVMHVDGVDMAALAELTRIEGLEATGRLRGSIPILFEGGTFEIGGGRLDATGPGTLSFRSDRAADLLRGQGLEIDQMLRALEDFRYETLGLDLDKSASDDLALKLSLLGNNPGVLDGYPFRINLNLKTQITPLLNALAVAYRMSRETLNRVWTKQ